MGESENSLNYYNYAGRQFKCRACDWTGLGESLVQGEAFRECFEVLCPNCHAMVAAIMYPTLAESRSNPGAESELDRLARLNFERRQQEYLERRLRAPEQLPELEFGAFVAEWDQIGNDIVIRCGSKVLFSEPSSFECYDRYKEIASIMKEKYGGKMLGLIPTKSSCLDLYGDSIASRSILNDFHLQMFGMPIDFKRSV